MYAKQVASLQAWVDRLHAELNRQEYRPRTETPDTLLQQALFAQRKAAFDFQVQEFDQKIAAYQAQALQSASDIAMYQKRLAVAIELEKKRRELERLQVGSQIDLLNAIDNRIEISRDLADAVATHAAPRRRSPLPSRIATTTCRTGFPRRARICATSPAQLSDAKENSGEGQSPPPARRSARRSGRLRDGDRSHLQWLGGAVRRQHHHPGAGELAARGRGGCGRQRGRLRPRRPEDPDQVQHLQLYQARRGRRHRAQRQSEQLHQHDPT